MRKFFIVPAIVALAGCQQNLPEPRPVLVDSVSEAGETHISVLSVEDWASAKAALNVKFNLTAADALEAAIPRTSTYEERLLDIFAANLNVAPPQTSVSGTSTTDQDDVVTSTVTRTRSDGQVPGGDVIPAPEKPNVRDLPGLGDKERNDVLGRNDPLLQYQTARTIQQYVTVLDRVIENAPKVDGYQPYLVTLQVTSFPLSKHQPYDIYVDLSFFPKSDADADAPLVYPVLITDNLEGQSVSRSAELIRQIGLAANILRGGFGGSLGISSFNARAGAVFGTDLTSTFTVGKSSENSLAVVLGAARNPVSDYAMIRRTHNISLLMLVPKEIVNAADDSAKVSDESANSQPAIDLLTTTELRRPDRKGSALPLRKTENELVETAITLLRERKLDRKKTNEELTVLLNNAWPKVVGGKFQEFKNLPGVKKHGYAEPLYHTISDVLGKSPNFKTTAIPLPQKAKPKPKQPFCVASKTAAAFDDPTAGEMRVVITGASGTAPRDLTATLNLSANKVAYPIVANRIEQVGGKLVMIFPSAARLGLAQVAPKGAALTLEMGSDFCAKGGKSHRVAIVYAVAPTAEDAKKAAAKAEAAKPKAEAPKASDPKPAKKT